MFERLRTMLTKEFTQILRDPKMRFIVFGVPIVQIILFGYAVNTDVKNISTGIYDMDNSSASREFVEQLVSSGYFTIVQRIGAESEIRDLMDKGGIKAVVRINRGFEELVRGGRRTAQLQIIIDGTDPNTARIVLSHGIKIAQHFSNQILLERFIRSGAGTPERASVQLESRAWFNENLESRNYMVPGVMAQMVLIVTMMLSSMSVVREKEIGTMEQIIVTPIKRWEFIIGKTLPFALIGYINVAIVTLVAAFWFETPMRGSLLFLFGATGLFLLSTLGFGLFISTISRTQQQAMMSSFMFTFPAMLLSGFAFPIENMPQSIQYFTYLNPLRYYLVIIRGVFLKGVGSGILWPQLLGLFILGAVILCFAVKRFRKQLA